MDEVDYLRRRIAALERKLQAVGETLCPLCKGSTTRSNRYHKRFCAQEFGACGELLLRNSRYRSGDLEPKATFHRTTINDSGRIELLNPTDPGFLHWWFIGGKQVTREEYVAAMEANDG